MLPDEESQPGDCDMDIKSQILKPSAAIPISLLCRHKDTLA